MVDRKLNAAHSGVPSKFNDCGPQVVPQKRTMNGYLTHIGLVSVKRTWISRLSVPTVYPPMS
jgi:hypothetical protein